MSYRRVKSKTDGSNQWMNGLFISDGKTGTIKVQ